MRLRILRRRLELCGGRLGYRLFLEFGGMPWWVCCWLDTVCRGGFHGVIYCLFHYSLELPILENTILRL